MNTAKLKRASFFNVDSMSGLVIIVSTAHENRIVLTLNHVVGGIEISGPHHLAGNAVNA